MGDVARLGWALGDLFWHRVLAGAGRGVSPLPFFVGPLQSGLQAVGIELGWAGSISACWTEAQGSRLNRAGSAAEQWPCSTPPGPPPLPRLPGSRGNRGGEVMWGSGTQPRAETLRGSRPRHSSRGRR